MMAVMELGKRAARRRVVLSTTTYRHRAGYREHQLHAETREPALRFVLKAGFRPGDFGIRQRNRPPVYLSA